MCWEYASSTFWNFYFSARWSLSDASIAVENQTFSAGVTKKYF
jgi:hypothetical protein